jgi:hypothetical protein
MLAWTRYKETARLPHCWQVGAVLLGAMNKEMEMEMEMRRSGKAMPISRA